MLNGTCGRRPSSSMACAAAGGGTIRLHELAMPSSTDSIRGPDERRVDPLPAPRPQRAPALCCLALHPPGPHVHRPPRPPHPPLHRLPQPRPPTGHEGTAPRLGTHRPTPRGAGAGMREPCRPTGTGRALALVRPSDVPLRRGRPDEPHPRLTRHPGDGPGPTPTQGTPSRRTSRTRDDAARTTASRRCVTSAGLGDDQASVLRFTSTPRSHALIDRESYLPTAPAAGMPGLTDAGRRRRSRVLEYGNGAVGGVEPHLVSGSRRPWRRCCRRWPVAGTPSLRPASPPARKHLPVFAHPSRCTPR
jgi:hypothetical protein